MKLKLRIITTAVLVSGIALFIIFVLSEGEKREVKNLIITYNNVLQKAHLELNSGLMGRLTSEKQLKKIDSYIAYSLKNRRIVKGEIKDLKFIDIKIGNDLATVSTTERWVWSYVDPYSKKPVSKIFDEMYGNTYNLKKIRGHWVVDNLVSNVIDKAGG